MVVIRAFALFFCLLALDAKSQEAKGTVAEGGASYRLFWEDGRVAKPVVETFDVATISAEMTYKSNTCAAATVPKCVLQNNIRLKKFMYIWEQNPVDPERVGEFLMVLTGSGASNSLTEMYVLTQYAQVMANRLGLDTEGAELKDALVCDSFEWLPAGGSVVVPAWFSQFELYSSELCFSLGDDCPLLSQYSAGAKDVHLRRVRADTYEVYDIGLFNAPLMYLANMALGINTEFVFDVSDYKNHPGAVAPDLRYPNPTCRVEFGFDINQVVEQLRALEASGEAGVYDPAKIEEVVPDSHGFQQHFLPWLLRREVWEAVF